MHSLIFGSGSAGRRHESVLRGFGHAVTVASRRRDAGSDLQSALSALGDGEFSYVVVANETASHHEVVAAVVESGYTGPMLIEKPCCVEWSQLGDPVGPVAVGYNLRYHKMIAALQEWAGSMQLYAASFRVGQNLGSWRPDRPIAQQYSAWRRRGGGALADLSHEIDLATWLLGAPSSIGAVGGRVSRLPGDADDAWAIVMRTARAPVVSVTLDYLDELGTREITLHAEKGTIVCDLMAGTITTREGVEDLGDARELMNASYVAMHERFLAGDSQSACSVADAVQVEDLMERIRTDAGTRR